VNGETKNVKDVRDIDYYNFGNSLSEQDRTAAMEASPYFKKRYSYGREEYNWEHGGRDQFLMFTGLGMGSITLSKIGAAFSSAEKIIDDINNGRYESIKYDIISSCYKPFAFDYSELNLVATSKSRMSFDSMRELTKKNGVEYAQVYFPGLGKNGRDGFYGLYEGHATSVQFPGNTYTIAHTHPTNTGPSGADYQSLAQLGQNKAYVILPNGKNIEYGYGYSSRETFNSKLNNYEFVADDFEYSSNYLVTLDGLLEEPYIPSFWVKK